MSEIPFEAFEELRLCNFRPFVDARLKLSDMTVLVGRNGAGKSSIMDALEFLHDATAYSLLTAVEKRGGLSRFLHQGGSEGAPKKVSLAVQMRLAVSRVVYGFTLEAVGGADGFRVAEEVLATFPKRSFGYQRSGDVLETEVVGVTPALSGDSLALPLIAAAEPLWKAVRDALRGIQCYSLSPPLIRLEHDVGEGNWLEKTGANVGDVLKRIESRPEELQWIVETLGSVTPGIVNVGTRASDGRRLVLFEQEAAPGFRRTYRASQMSEGTLRCLATLLALRQENRPSLVFLDEVEDSIHPMALFAMIDAIAGSLDRTQVLLTSHSPEALMHQEITEERTRIVTWEQGVSHVYSVLPAPPDVAGYSFSVGELLQSNALPPSEAPERVTGGFFEEAL